MNVTNLWRRLGRQLGLLLLAAAFLPGCSSVVARVNGENITRKEFTAALETAAGRQVLQELILRQLVLERAEAEGVTPTPEEVNAELQKFKQEQFGGDEQQFIQWLQQNGRDDTDILEEIRFQKALFNLQTLNVKPTDEDLKRFFDEYRDRLFDKPQRVTFRQIVLPSEEQAQQVIQRLNGEEENFGQLAQQLSINRETAENGGEQRDIPLPMIEEAAQPIADALKALQPNQITQEPVAVTDPNSGQSVYMVLKLVEMKPAEEVEFEAVKDEVRQAFLAANAIPQQQLLAQLAQNSDVVVLHESLKAAVEPTFSSGAAAAGGAPGAAPGAAPGTVPPAALGEPDMTSPTFLDEDPTAAAGAAGAGDGTGLESPAPAVPATPGNGGGAGQ